MMSGNENGERADTTPTKTKAPLAPCNICGGEQFEYSKWGRGGHGYPTMCSGCKSLERHRVARRIYEGIPRELMAGKRALQFAPDRSVESSWWGEFETSTFSGENSLDLEAIDRETDSYDWLILNHVLEHVEDDKQAMRELVRVARENGIIQVMVPDPMTRDLTEDWGFADIRVHGHYRTYGKDFVSNMLAEIDELLAVEIVDVDASTGSRDVCFFFSLSTVSLSRIIHSTAFAMSPYAVHWTRRKRLAK